MNILQINTTVNSGSTGRIAENIGEILIKRNDKSYIAFGRDNESASQKIQIGNSFSQQLHGLKTRLFDRQGFGSGLATEKLLKEINLIKPDIIHLHNLHGYYIHIGILFNYLKEKKIPVVWTLHDCWPFTGHCTYFDFVKCDKWKTHCYQCPLSKRYPESWFIDNSRSNFDLKRSLFNGVENLTLVTPSQWLKNLLKKSFLNHYPVSVIHNGINLNRFKPINEKKFLVKDKLNLTDEFIILGVASVWDRRKGLKDFIQLSELINATDKIILLGLSAEQRKGLPQNIIAIERTESVDEMVELYNMADVFVNPTWVDNFPTTNIEALACGTPVITYNTGGSIEAIDADTGFIVEKGDIQSVLQSINEIKIRGKKSFTEKCRNRAEMFFNNEDRFGDYINLYDSILQKTTA